MLYGVFFLSACLNHIRYHDPHLKQSEQEIKENFLPVKQATQTKQILARPRYAKEFFAPVCVALSPHTPLDSVLMTLADQANVNIALDPALGSPRGIVYKGNQQPFIEAVEHICQLGHLRYEVRNDTLFIGKDVPYLHTYDIQFLVGSRKTENNFSVTTDLNNPFVGAVVVLL